MSKKSLTLCNLLPQLILHLNNFSAVASQLEDHQLVSWMDRSCSDVCMHTLSGFLIVQYSP